MKFEQGASYFDNTNKIWQYLGKTSGNVHHITLKDSNIGYSTTCDHHGEFFCDGPCLNKLIRKLPTLIVGKVYLDNNGQPWRYDGVGAIKRGVKHKEQYIGPAAMIHQTGLLYGYDRKNGVIYG